ncbi:unnamed protein product [Dovyalis caffra]|uniref:GB1/RHD3-type G domain-containing protein n=1 Tax=Dovyalis caffra TaxID=77055 RepID=A0AAV1RLG9_9ROSI|nr:unnamed protein product [Dovyalis caffra]
MKMEEGMQLIDGNGKFNMEGLQEFMTTTKFAQSHLSYAIVAIIGPQSSGKSTLMNQTFLTNFKEMDAYKGRGRQSNQVCFRGQTTKGIWIAKCSDIDPFTIAMDFEGTDSSQRGEEDTAFEKQSTLFALAVADIVLINMWYKDIGLEHAASRPLLRTVFQVMKRLFKPRKKTLFFVIRDHTKTPFEYLETTLLEDIEKIWDAVAEPETHGSAALSDFFNVEITALSSYEFEEEKFKQQVAQLRQRFVHSVYPGGLVGDRREVEPASVFSIRAETIWKTIKDNKDLDLPALKVMVAAVRCEEVAEEKLKRFTSDTDWLAMKEAVQAGPVSGFGGEVSSILERYISEYEMEVIYFDQEVRNAKRGQLLSKALLVVHETYVTMLVHLYSNTVESFKTRLEESLNEGQEYVASFRLWSQSCILSLIKDVKIEWNALKFREKLIFYMLSELMAKGEKDLTHELEKRVESLIEAGERDTWTSIRDLLECKTEATVSEFSDAVVSLELHSSAVNTKLQHLREFGRNIVEKKAREAADAERVLMHMKERFTEFFIQFENSVSWYDWTTEKGVDEIERNALSGSLKFLSIMAAMRLDDMPDQIENVLFSSLMDGTIAVPSSQDEGIGATMDPLASDTWEEIKYEQVSPKATTLLKPKDCKSLWMKFKKEIKPTVTGARSRQDARRRTRNEILTGLATGLGIAIAGPVAGIAFFARATRR